MPQLIDAARIANETTLRYTSGSNPTAVINLALPCDYGRKDDSGKKPCQWVEASLWGKQAEALAPYLIKGQWVSFTLDDVHNEEYQSGGATRTKMVGRVTSIKLIGSPPQKAQPEPAKPAQSTMQNFDNFDGLDDIPF